MYRQRFLNRVKALRGEGKSIRAIAAELGVHKGRVERALPLVFRLSIDESPGMLQALEPRMFLKYESFVDRDREMLRLKAALEDRVKD